MRRRPQPAEEYILYYKDHAPPHFHAIYAQYDAAVGIDPMEILRGSLPRRAQYLPA